MTLRQTSFELAPAGTAIPTTGVAGDGDAFNVGTNGTGATWTSDATAAALADGSLCALLSVGATATTTHRTWTGFSSNDVSSRFYIYLPAYPSGAWDIWTATGAAIIARTRMTPAGELSMINAAATVASTTGFSVPLNTLVRIETQLHLAADATGTYNIAAYLGHSTTPIAGVTLSGNVAYTAALPAANTRIGVAANNPINFNVYFDAYAFDDTGAPIGPVGAALPIGPPVNVTIVPVSGTAQDVTWTPVAGALAYDIERDGTIIAPAFAGTTYHDTGLTSGQAYSYRVRTVF